MIDAIFLDRDGVIIENRASYVRSWADVEIFPQALKALKRLAQRPLKIVMVTNQSAVGRGIITYDEAEKINRRLVEVIEEAGGRIDRVYMCPHAPQDDCHCRKPRPGMLFQGRDDLGLDLQHAVMVGDAVTDLQAGWAAAVAQAVLVKTGRGLDQLQLIEPTPATPFLVYKDLADACAALFPHLES